MNAFENAKKFFEACEAPAGWAGCKQYVAENATFIAQSEPLADTDTVEAYCEWMAALLFSQGYSLTANNRSRSSSRSASLKCNILAVTRPSGVNGMMVAVSSRKWLAQVCWRGL